MTRVCLDTSAYSNFRRGKPAVVNAIDRADWIGVPCVALGEIWAGFIAGSRAERNIAELEDFLAEPLVEVLAIDRDVARIYGEIVVDLRRKGRPLPTNDIWIAATAARFGASVLTFDAHFLEVDRVGAQVLVP
ncbi:MAG: type II toxin-antitoxin system VapC family toxin [Gammaproteobacteria bacterium]|nr:type II toxin-antitoxin system VapC family toxin [Gammaproteobacteria bacterium]MXY52733.1 type II toxin-antitoxin system VapC family toxin [Gammaproteobacteria bacterium]MYB36128.1 type II toxin-antitoxin system VapC family toxin [Gammaproteobacteria bacterium]